MIGSVALTGGQKVLFIDADPDMNLATVLQVPDSKKIIPIAELKELIAERTGVQVGQPAPFFKMNPRVNDIPDTHCLDHRGFKLMVMGTISKGGGGCACPENAFLKSLLSYLVIARDEWVIIDMEAGIEHLGRGTAVGMDCMVVVVEPNKTSIETAHRIRELADDLLVKNLVAIGNKIMEEEDREFLSNGLREIPLIGYIDYSRDMKELSLGLVSPLDVTGVVRRSFDDIVESLERTAKNSVKT
jgi:CO dehydrogenase maturation factor